MLSSKDVNFMGYTYKNFEIVNDNDVSQMGTYSVLAVDYNYSIYLVCLFQFVFVLKCLFLFFSWIEEEEQQS